MDTEFDRTHIQRAKNGDMDAFEGILRAYEKAIYIMAYRMCANEQDALDIGQETALRLWRNLGSFRGDAKFSTWVHRIAYNTCVDFLRKRKGNFVALDALGEAGIEPAAPAEDTPERAAERAETLERIDLALLRLPEDQRAAVIQRDVMGMSYDEIACAQDANLNTVKSRISRGRKALAALLAI